MTTAQPGLLAVWNAIAPEHDGTFNVWYDSEHLDERLAVPGFRNARRYRAADDRHRYAALYDLDSPAVLVSAAYRAVLASPSPRTRAIMPHFRDVSRAACAVVFDSRPDARPRAALAILGLRDTDGNALARLSPSGTARIRVARPDPEATGGPTPEQALRSAPDRLPPPFVLVEADTPTEVSDAVAAMGAALAVDWDRRFTLIVDRSASLA